MERGDSQEILPMTEEEAQRVALEGRRDGMSMGEQQNMIIRRLDRDMIEQGQGITSKEFAERRVADMLHLIAADA